MTGGKKRELILAIYDIFEAFMTLNDSAIPYYLNLRLFELIEFKFII